nr:effector-associated domain EAD1-containing protein [Phyllobacterium sp. KW56]
MPKLALLLDDLASRDFGRAIEILTVTGAYGETQFRKWLAAALIKNTRLTEQEAVSLGQLITRQRWSVTVDDLLKLLSLGREDLRPALRGAVDLISYLNRWLNKLTPVNSFEKWESVADLAAELYPTGPDHDALWERAGGRSADVLQNGNGRFKWREALRTVRYGREPRIQKLLGEMLRDYPQNQHLKLLANDPEFR